MAENVIDIIERAKSSLFALRQKLSEIKEKTNSGVNIFDAVGMTSQEIKHSAFLAWLLTPKQTHGLGNKFLKSFVECLFTYEPKEIAGIDNIKSNCEILYNSGISIADLEAFYADDKLNVEKEKVIINSESRIDIFIESQKTKTAIVIENKVFSSTHDNQLVKYERELENRRDWRKIFVYLTPEYELPKNDDGEYCENWCICGYRDILKLIGKMQKELSGTYKQKLDYLLGDYISMVDTNILKNNKELRSLCRQIRREHKEAVDILLAYTDNADKVAKLCLDWVTKNFHGLTIFKKGKLSFEFYTETHERYFSIFDEKIMSENGRPKLRCGLYNDGNIGIFMTLEKDENAKWSTAQLSILDKIAPNKKFEQSNKYCTLLRIVIMTEAQRNEDIDIVIPNVETSLKEFAEIINI